MDIFSTIGAAVQLIETVKKVIAIINTIRHARNRADELCLELQQLDSNLQAVRDLLATKDRLNFHQTSILVSGAACCDSKLKNLLGDLEMVQTSKRERSKWALKDERYHDTLQNIRAFSNTLHFAISFDSICLLTKSAEEAEEAFRIQEQSLHVLRSSHLITTRIEHKVDEGIIQWKASEALRRREKLLALIDDRLRISGSTSQEYRHDKFRQSRSKRTGLWFLMEPKFMRWTRSNTRLNVEVPHSRNFGNMEVARDANQYELEDMHVSASLADAIFLCQGPPGSGKSTLASLVVDSLCTSHNEEIGHCVYYYFDYNDEQDQLGLDLVLCFLRQIVQGSMTTDFQLPYTINQLEKEFLEPRGVKIESVCSFLHDIIRAHDVFYIVLDALDEIHTSNRSVILSLLSDLAKISSVKIFATSRQASDLGSLFLSSTAFEFRALDTDIQYYLRDEIAKANLSESHPIDEKLKDDIIAHILKIANGMFLLAKLSLKCVLDGASPGARRDALRKMPRDLPSYFEKTLNRIWNQPPDRRVIAANTLLRIIHLRMLPSVEQMRDALSIDLQGQRQLSHDYRPTLATILGCCHGFVRVGADDRLLFTHKAVHDFLCETMTFDRKLHLARLTIRYIQDPAFNGGPVSNPESYRREYPFLDCLALRWIRLLKDGLKDGGDDWSELFQTKPNLAFMYQYSYWRRGYNERYCAIEEARSVTPLMLACKAGTAESARRLLDGDPSLLNQATAIVGTTPLIMAASATVGSLETVRLLKERGARLHQENWYGNALHCAAENGKTRMCQYLIEYGLDPNRRSRKGRGKTPLDCTLDNDHVETFQALLRLGAKLDPIDFWEICSYRSTAIMRYMCSQKELWPKEASHIHQERVQSRRRLLTQSIQAAIQTGIGSTKTERAERCPLTCIE